ncbi:hypothetical protein D3C81_117260 [compost metagenome]|uniref:hypothetical protein n=1 Tax=Pseudomonas putida TaxID=303 RepID=UPI000281DB70|nr:site-specific recombinase [Pseudomonas putida LS46]
MLEVNDVESSLGAVIRKIQDVDHASLLLGHNKGDITERVYQRVGALAKPTK